MKKKTKNKKCSNKKCINKKFKGFTLIELLAVLVILAIILILAIPSVLNSLSSAKERTFIDYINKAYTLANQEITSKEALETCVSECTLFNLTKDMGLNNTGDFNGYVMVVDNNGESYDYYITLWNNDYMVYGIKYDKETLENLELKDFTSEDDLNLSPEYLAIKSGCDGYSDNTTNKCEPKDSQEVFESLINQLKKKQEGSRISCLNSNYDIYVFDLNDLFDNTIGLEGIILSSCLSSSQKEPSQETTFIFNDKYVAFINNAPCGTEKYVGPIIGYEAWLPTGSCGTGKWQMNAQYRSQKSYYESGVNMGYKDGLTGQLLKDKYR